MDKLQEWEQRRRDMGLVPGYARQPSPRPEPPSLHGERSFRSDGRRMNKLEEWDQRRRDMGLVAGVPRRPSSPFTPSDDDRAGVDAASDQAHMPFVLPVASADDPQGLKMAKDAARAGDLRTPEERRRFHDRITGENITDFNVLVEIAKSVKAGEE